jgi:hypothetical protein
MQGKVSIETTNTVLKRVSKKSNKIMKALNHCAEKMD